MSSDLLQLSRPFLAFHSRVKSNSLSSFPMDTNPWPPYANGKFSFCWTRLSVSGRACFILWCTAARTRLVWGRWYNFLKIHFQRMHFLKIRFWKMGLVRWWSHCWRSLVVTYDDELYDDHTEEDEYEDDDDNDDNDDEDEDNVNNNNDVIGQVMEPLLKKLGPTSWPIVIIILMMNMRMMVTTMTMMTRTMTTSTITMMLLVRWWSRCWRSLVQPAGNV